MLRAFNDGLLKLYADVTKCDLLVNNLVQRARSRGFEMISCSDHVPMYTYELCTGLRSIKAPSSTRSVAPSSAGKPKGKAKAVAKGGKGKRKATV